MQRETSPSGRMAALTAADWDEHLPYLGTTHPAWEFDKWRAGAQP